MSSPPSIAADLHGMVPGSYVHLLSEYLHRQGVHPRLVLGAERVSVAEQIPVTLWRQWLASAAEQLNDPLLGLHLGQSVTAAHFGVMGYVLLSCPNLGAALTRMAEYERLLYDVNPMQQRLEGEEVVLEWGVARGRPGALVDECAIAMLAQFTRNILREPAKLNGICFVNETPANPQAYRDWFDCPVEFAASVTQLRFPATLLAAPLRQPDASLLAILAQQADTLLAALPKDHSFTTEARRAIARLAAEGQLSLQAVASSLHTSSRSLHRRLAESGTNFHRLRDDTLRCLADGYLRDPQLQLAEVAQLLGYSEQSAFNRAYRRWRAATPGRVRRGL